MRNRWNEYLVYDFIRITGAVPGLLWMRPKILYENENARRPMKGGMLLVANHTGLLDPVYLMVALWKRRHHFVCLDTFFEGRFRAWLFRQFHCIPVNRENVSMDFMRRVTEELKRGHLVSMFPEGHVVETGEIAPFKSGVIMFTLRSGCPIVPVYVQPPKKWYRRLRVVVGEPLNLTQQDGKMPGLAAIDQAARDLTEKEKKLQELCG